MAENLDPVQKDPIPLIITDDYLNESLQKTEEFIKELRSQENYDLANQILRLVTILENIHFQLKNEEQKSQGLLDQHIDATGRIEEAMKISQKDHDLINNLKNDVKSAWNEADASKLREQHIAESLNVTREGYLILKKKMNMTASNLETTEELGEHKATILQQCERLNIEVDELNRRLLVQRVYSEEIQKKLDDSLEKNRDLYRQWDSATNESMSDKKKIEKLQKSFVELNEDNNRVTEGLMYYKNIGEMRHKRLTEREKQVMDLSEKLERFKGDNSALSALKSRLELSLKSYRNDIVNFKHDMNRFQAYVRMKDDENRKLIGQRESEVKKVANLLRKISSVEKVMSRQEQDISYKKNEIMTAEKEKDLIKKSSDDLKRDNNKLSQKIEQMMREIERLNASISTLKEEKQKIEEEQVFISNDLKSSIEREKRSNENVKKLQSNIETVESEKSFLNESIKQLNEDIDTRKKQHEKIRLELNEANENVAQFKYEYNLSLKRLKDARADYQRCHEKESEVKDRLMKFKSQIDDVNDKLTVKLAEIVAQMKKIKRLEKKNREIKRDYERSQETLRLCRVQLTNVDHENKLLKEEIRENTKSFIKMKSQADKILRERDLIATQMYRKTDENALLEDQVSMLRMSIDRGNSMYSERMDDIKIMKIEIQSLRSQSSVLKRGLQNTTDMRHEVLQLHRRLNQERTKAKVLEDEMSTPMNVHRWRKLKHRDPARMELLKKCQRLQRNCLRQSAKHVKADELINRLQQKVTKLENEFPKRPHSEVSEKLLLTRTKLQENTKRMKAAIALSRATESDVNLKDNTINNLQKELTDLKSQLFKEKQSKLKVIRKLKEMKEDSGNYISEKEMVKKLENLGNAFKLEMLK